MVCFSAVFLIYRKVADLNVRSELLFLYYFGLCTVILFFYLLYNKIPLTVSTDTFYLILASAVLGVVGNIVLLNAIKGTPNPGYALAVNGVNTLVVTIASIFIFKSEFSLVKGIGIILAIIGVILLGL